MDGRTDTRWSSEFSDPQWLAVDLGKVETIDRVELLWEAAYAKSFSVEVSLDEKTWKEVYKTDRGDGRPSDIRFPPTPARWVCFTGTQRADGIRLFALGVSRLPRTRPLTRDSRWLTMALAIEVESSPRPLPCPDLCPSRPYMSIFQALIYRGTSGFNAADGIRSGFHGA